MDLPSFRFHPDPVRSGSVTPSDKKCRCCNKKRGFIYTGPVYAEEELGDALCPWCIADGNAHQKFDATFVDSEAFTAEVSEDAINEVCCRTPGFSSWQSEQWPVCCGQPAAFVQPFGIADMQGADRALEGPALSHIIYKMNISGGAATRLLKNLKRDQSPTAYVFRCVKCEAPLFHIDQL